jgi:hypothetical protein
MTAQDRTLSNDEGLRVFLRSRIETTDPIDAFARAVACEDVSATGFVDLFQSLNRRNVRERLAGQREYRHYTRRMSTRT